MDAILPFKARQIQKGIDLILHKGHRKVGVLGFAFKAGTDDLRESPIVEVIEHLIGKGIDLRLYDRSVNLAALTGANRDYILNHIPHISRLMVNSLAEVLEFADTIVIGNASDEFKNIEGRLRPSQVVVDFVRVSARQSDRNYDGICW